MKVKNLTLKSEQASHHRWAQCPLYIYIYIIDGHNVHYIYIYIYIIDGHNVHYIYISLLLRRYVK